MQMQLRAAAGGGGRAGSCTRCCVVAQSLHRAVAGRPRVERCARVAAMCCGVSTCAGAVWRGKARLRPSTGHMHKSISPL